MIRNLQRMRIAVGAGVLLAAALIAAVAFGAFAAPTSATAPDQITMSWAAITKVDVGQNDAIAAAQAASLLVAANVCAINMTDADCEMRLGSAVSSGIHMLHDDLPFAIEAVELGGDLLRLPWIAVEEQIDAE